MKISSLRWGVLLLCIGLVFLAINLDFLDYGVWHSIITLWPVFLIALGIEMIFRRTKLWYLALLSPLLIAGAFIYAALAAKNGDSWELSYHWRDNYEMKTRQYEFERDDSIKKLKLDIDCGAGDFWLGPTSDRLFTADFEYRGGEPDCRLIKSDAEATVRVRSEKSGKIRLFKGMKRWGDARLFAADWLPLEISLNSAASAIELDLRELQVEDLDVNTGASSLSVRFGCKSAKLNASIDSGVSDIKIFVPHQAGIAIAHDSALSSTNFRDIGLNKVNGRYRSDNFETASCRIEININSGVSSIALEYY